MAPRPTKPTAGLDILIDGGIRCRKRGRVFRKERKESSYVQKLDGETWGFWGLSGDAAVGDRPKSDQPSSATVVLAKGQGYDTGEVTRVNWVNWVYSLDTGIAHQG
jgi:hypothetical protein